MTERDENATVYPLQPDGKRGYSWKPFEPGNLAHLQHGAYSPRKVDPLAQSYVDQLLEQAAAPESQTGYLLDPSYRPAIWSLARVTAQVELLSEWLASRDSAGVDKDGEELGALRALMRCEARAESLRSKLGLDPLSRARLGRDVAAGQVDMAKLLAALAETSDDDDQELELPDDGEDD